jgi:hypothetical protein
VIVANSTLSIKIVVVVDFSLQLWLFVLFKKIIAIKRQVKLKIHTTLKHIANKITCTCTIFWIKRMIKVAEKKLMATIVLKRREYFRKKITHLYHCIIFIYQMNELYHFMPQKSRIVSWVVTPAERPWLQYIGRQPLSCPYINGKAKSDYRREQHTGDGAAGMRGSTHHPIRPYHIALG